MHLFGNVVPYPTLIHQEAHALPAAPKDSSSTRKLPRTPAPLPPPGTLIPRGHLNRMHAIARAAQTREGMEVEVVLGLGLLERDLTLGLEIGNGDAGRRRPNVSDKWPRP
ncbi:MAG: hypothetical protein Q9169_005871 [Polycauliona sp. 2 TL-2023]